MPQYFDENGYPVDPFAEDDQQYGQPAEPPQTRNPIREQLRRTENKLKEAEKRISELEPRDRRLTFLEAGVDLEHPMASYFVQGYQGELTADAVKAAAEPAGLLKQPAQQPGQTQQPGQQQTFQPQQMQQPGVPQPPGVQEAFQQAQTAYRAMQQATDATMPGTRDFDAEMRSAPNQQEANRILTEKHAAMGMPGVPAIVHD